MNAPVRTHQFEQQNEAPPPGMLEYETRTNVRDLIRLYGFEEARAIVAGILNDEADRRRA